MPNLSELRMPERCSMAVSPREQVPWTRGEQPLPPAKRPEACTKWERMWGCADNREVGSEAAILQRKRNSSPVKRPRAENLRDSSAPPKLRTSPAKGEW